MKTRKITEVMENKAIKEITEFYDDAGTYLKKNIRFLVNPVHNLEPGIYTGEMKEYNGHL